MTYLLDTNIVSELRKRDPDPLVVAWYGTVTSAQLFLSVLTIGEIRLGIERLRRKDNTQADLLEQWLQGLRVAYRVHIDQVVAVGDAQALQPLFQADLLEQWLQGLRVAYRDHLIDVDTDVAEEWGRLNVPDQLPIIDG